MKKTTNTRKSEYGELINLNRKNASMNNLQQTAENEAVPTSTISTNLKNLFFLMCFIFTAGSVFAQTTYSWRSDGSDEIWSNSNNWWITNVGTATPGGNEILSFDNTKQASTTNDLTNTSRYQIIFTTSNWIARTISGTTENTFYDYGGNVPKIENYSSYRQTIGFPIKSGYENFQLNPINGPLYFTGAINNNGKNINVYGGDTLVLNSLTGSGGLTTPSNGAQTPKIRIDGTCNFSGNTYIGKGQLILNADMPNSPIIVTSGCVATINAQDVDINSLTIESGGQVIVTAGNSLTVNGTLTNNGTLTLESDATHGTATLKTTTVATGTTGTYNIQQYLSAARNWYISSPLNSANAPSGASYYSRDVASDSWSSSFTSGTLTAGIGYIALPSAAGTITFSGTTINNGDVSVSLTGTDKYNLIGNPYPCHLTWNNTFYSNNSSLIGSSIWVRTNGGTTNNSGLWKFATYNASSGLSTNGTNVNIIAPMQAFWVKTVAPGSLTLGSALTKSHNSSNPLKVVAERNSEQAEIRLEIDNGVTTDEMLLYSNPNALNTFDNYDSEKMSVNSASCPEIYSLAGTKEVAINGMTQLPLDTEIPIGFRTGTTNTFALKATKISNIGSDVQLIVKDNKLVTEQNLSTNSTYSFSADAMDNTSRFSIILRSATAITNLDENLQNSRIIISENEGILKIQLPTNNITSGSISLYNMAGQLIHSQAVTAQTCNIDKKLNKGIYLIKTRVNNVVYCNKTVVE